jgi:hypothetical protein
MKKFSVWFFYFLPKYFLVIHGFITVSPSSLQVWLARLLNKVDTDDVGPVALKKYKKTFLWFYCLKEMDGFSE